MTSTKLKIRAAIVLLFPEESEQNMICKHIQSNLSCCSHPLNIWFLGTDGPLCKGPGTQSYNLSVIPAQKTTCSKLTPVLGDQMRQIMADTNIHLWQETTWSDRPVFASCGQFLQADYTAQQFNEIHWTASWDRLFQYYPSFKTSFWQTLYCVIGMFIILYMFTWIHASACEQDVLGTIPYLAE